MNSLEYIDDYFKNAPHPEATRAFEQRIESDPAFADEVAFYLSATGLLKEEADAGRRERFRHLQPTAVVRPMRRWYAVPAAAIIVVVASIALLWNREPGMEQLADEYISNKLATQSVTMGRMDSMQSALHWYNEKNYVRSLSIFEALVSAGPESADAVKYAGLAALQAKDYEKAILYFSRLSRMDLQVNPGMFYHAVTLMKRDQPGDLKAAKVLLEQVVRQGKYGKDEAQLWLRTLDE